MLCQNCHKNEATIHLYTSVNGQRTEINLCQDCYQRLRNQANEGINNMAQNPNGFSSFEDLFNALGNPQMANGVEQGPQTQTGGGNGNNGRGRQGGNGILDQYGVDLTALAKKVKLTLLLAVTRKSKELLKF